jgi:integrase
MRAFSSVLADRLEAYVKLQRALGYQFDYQTVHLHAFDEYLVQRSHTEPLTQEIVIAFATDDPSDSMDQRARRYHVVRPFCEYLATFDPQAPVLDPHAVPRFNARPARHILTDEELAHLLQEARNISQHNPVRGVTLHAIIGLAASTGLRRGEVVRLDNADVDIESGVLLIKKTKLKKDRLVPVHPTTLDVMRNYAALRDSAYPDRSDPAFFVTMWRKRFNPNTLQQQFCIAARQAGLRGPTGRGLTFHDLRHRFAVKRLAAWYSAGIDVQAMLPALATYMGHVHYSDTAYYLTATAELLGLAAERYNSRFDKAEVQP